MVLGNIFKKQEEDTEHYWSLVIGKNWTHAAIWRINGEITEIVAEGVPASWQEDNIETLVAAADSSLSSAAANVVEEAQEPNKVVFGLMPAWVEEGSIKKEYLGILKKVSSELELSPAGFVVMPEAIVHYIKVKEGAPLNAILIGLLEDSIEVSLVQSGKILGTVDVSRSISLGADLSEGLARLASLEQYPSRILLYDHRVGNLDEARQNLLNVDWKDLKISFLHTPKVQILPENVGVMAVSLAGGAEVGHANQIIKVDEGTTEEEEQVIEGEKNENIEEVEAKTTDLGFVENADIAQNNEPEITHGEPEEFHKNVEIPTDFPDKKEVLQPRFQTETKKTSVLSIFNVFSKIRPSRPSNGAVPSPSHKESSRSFARLIFIPGIVLFLLLAAGGAAYWYLPKASVTVYVAPKTFEKTIEFTVDSQVTGVDKDKKAVPGVLKETQVSGEKTVSTSGTKTIGDRAKGKVIILHVGSSAVFKAGTILSGPNSLKFTLDEDVKIATGSSITNPSKVASTITAADIGAQYNLASGTEFSVSNYSKGDYVAQNDEVFSGGTSRSVSAVSEEDRAKLEKGLSDELIGKGGDQIKNGLGDKETLVDDSIAIKPDQKTYSNKVGEESNTLKLAITGKVTALIIQQNDINQLIYSELEKEIPQGFGLPENQVEISYKAVVQKEQKGKTPDKKDKTKPILQQVPQRAFIATVKANFLPKVNPIDIAKQLAGKSPTVAKTSLSSIPGYTRAEISFSFLFPGRLGTLPHISKNISVEVSAEK